MTRNNLSMQDMDIITTISDTGKTKVSLVSLRENAQLAVLKRYTDNKMQGCYEQIKKLKSAYFPEIYAQWKEQDDSFLLEEYIAGVTLLEKIGEGGRFSEKEITGWMVQICEALRVLHGATPPIIHRDIKPENIMLTPNGKIKLIDFDVAREYKAGKGCDTVMLGTREYASPEQFGFMQTDVRSDIYSVGIVFSELLERAAAGSSYVGRARKIIDKATMFDPGKRYRDVEELSQDIKKLEKKQNRFFKPGIVVAGMVIGVAVAIAGFGLADRMTVPVQDDAVSWGNSVSEPEAEAETVPVPEMIETVPMESDETVQISDGIEKILPQEAYEYISIEEEVQAKAQFLMENRDYLYTLETFEDNDSGMYSVDQETVIGKNYVTMRFLKSNPRDLVLCNSCFEGTDIAKAYCVPYLEDLGTDGNRIPVDTDDFVMQRGNVVAVSKDFLQTLEPGPYTFYLDLVNGENSEASVLVSFYLVVHGEEEDVTNFRVRVYDSIAYYVSEKENSVVFFINNTPYSIQEIGVGNRVLGPDEYTLVNDGFGVVFSPEFLKQYEALEKLDIILTMQNGKQAMCRVIYLHHFETGDE